MKTITCRISVTTCKHEDVMSIARMVEAIGGTILRCSNPKLDVYWVEAKLPRGSEL